MGREEGELQYVTATGAAQPAVVAMAPPVGNPVQTATPAGVDSVPLIDAQTAAVLAQNNVFTVQQKVRVCQGACARGSVSGSGSGSGSARAHSAARGAPRVRPLPRGHGAERPRATRALVLRWSCR